MLSSGIFPAKTTQCGEKLKCAPNLMQAAQPDLMRPVLCPKDGIPGNTGRAPCPEFSKLWIPTNPRWRKLKFGPNLMQSA